MTKPKNPDRRQLRGLDNLASRIAVDENGCWLWTGPITRDGYGSGGDKKAHLFAYNLVVGPVPPGLELDHVCCVKLCANPWHLEPVTHAENVRRHWARLTHCKHGHEFTPANTRVFGNGRRVCRSCERERGRAYHLSRRAAANEVEPSA